MSDELTGLFDQPIESLNPVYRDTREDTMDHPDITQPVEQPAPQEPVQAEPALSEPAPADPVSAEPAPVQQAVEHQPVTPLDWKEVLKQEGYDDYAIGVLEYYKSTGDLAPYLEAKSVDYSKLPDEEILRRDLRVRYSELSDDDFELLYKKKVVDQYNLDEVYSEDEQRLGRIELRFAAKEVRDRLIEQQSKFKAPERQPQEDQSQAIAEQLQQWKSYVDSNPVTQSLLTAKRVSIGDGEQALNFELENTDSILQSTYDTQKFFGLFTGPDGNVDLNKWFKVVAYANNMNSFERAAINYGKTIGRQETFNEIRNPPKPTVGQVPGTPTGNAKDDLLAEFLNSGVHRGL